VDELKPQDFNAPKELTDELTTCAMAIHDLFDNGMSLQELHDFVDQIFAVSMNELAWFIKHNGRMND
jgi:hypothetical protein